MEPQKFSCEISGKKLTVEVNKLATLANGSVEVRYGDTVILATAVMSKKIREGINFFPLLVDYEERLYAAGKIKGSRFIKREGRPSDEAILAGRLIDRAIRPLFPSGMRNDVQVIITVLSVDLENDHDIPALLGASIALAISDIPWNGPIGAVRIAKIDNRFIINPTYQEREKSTLDLVVAANQTKINMLEVGANQVKEEDIIKAAAIAQEEIKKLTAFQKDIAKKIGPRKADVQLVKASEQINKEVKSYLGDKLEKIIFQPQKEKYVEESLKLTEELTELISEKFGEEKVSEALMALENQIDKIVHQKILYQNLRPDGRKLDEVRKLAIEVGILPRTHGSALFSRGTTQVLTVATLGAPGDEQIIEGIEENGTKRFMHHYSFPPYSVGEIAPLRGPGRREIGHGVLAEKALVSLVPLRDQFPYTIRLVSEILSSNGSSSMASVCGGSLALMDAGVPIKQASAGIAMGLVSDEKGNYKILTDIQGPEDHFGDMDLKVAGTKDGISAIQMDVKIEGIDTKILAEVLEQAKRARLYILGEMNKVIPTPRAELSPFAPRVQIIKINPEKIRDVIGPGGKVINEIIDETGVTIDIEDDGTVMVTSRDAEASRRAISWVKDLTREVKVGEIYEGKVMRTIDIGAFVEIWPGQEGLVHISELAPYRVRRVSDVVKVGDRIRVKIKSIDELGRINLTHKDV